MKHFLFIMSAAMAVSACSSGVETRISSRGIASPVAQSYMTMSTAEASPELQSAYAIVARSLSDKGFSSVKEAPLHLEVTVDRRDASLALGSASGPQSLSASKRRKPLQNCKDMEYRLGITITRIADGVELYKGTAAEHHCKLPMADALPALVDAALADFGQPRGTYSVKRKARD